jgi:hypothetical protein
MKKNTIITVLVLGGLAYWIYSRKKANKSLNPFSKSKNFTADEETFFDQAMYS